MENLEEAWKWREDRGVFAESKACRVFHGPGEGGRHWQDWAIDRLGDHYWVTCWGAETPAQLEKVVEFLRSKGAVSAVILSRPQAQVPENARLVLGASVQSRFVVEEGDARFWIQLEGVKHPGLFLDHAPLRRWLLSRSKGMRVLNTFAYTGSLSVAAALGGATEVTTIDLSKSSIRWAQENWALNGLPPEKAKFIAGDVFEWLPRLKKLGARFECVILDPPSFSHGSKGRFSTAKDLTALHMLALDVLSEDGVLITSINSANISRLRFERDLAEALAKRSRSATVLAEIAQPDTFPSRWGDPEGRYLKGWILRISSGKGASKRSHSPDMGWSKHKRKE